MFKGLLQHAWKKGVVAASFEVIFNEYKRKCQVHESEAAIGDGTDPPRTHFTMKHVFKGCCEEKSTRIYSLNVPLNKKHFTGSKIKSSKSRDYLEVRGDVFRNQSMRSRRDGSS